MSFTFDPISGRYRDSSTGRFVTERAIRDAVDIVIDESTRRAVALTAQLQAGRLSLADWQAGMLEGIKQAHVAAGVAAAGGLEQMSPAKYGYLGSQIKIQYQYLRAWVADIVAGTAPLDGRLLVRAELYGQAARGTYESAKGREQQQRGADQERNRLGAADHCPGCLEQNARGWVKIGRLLPVGARTCLTRCRCTIIYRREADAPAQEAAA